MAELSQSGETLIECRVPDTEAPHTSGLHGTTLPRESFGEGSFVESSLQLVAGSDRGC